MKLSTRHKMKIASFMARIAKLIVSCSGRDPKSLVCSRRGLNWELDLNEGIDLSVFVFGEFEPDVSEALRREVSDGAVVVDIGANIGAHTIPLLNLVGPVGSVIAIEPTAWAFKKLLRNSGLNPTLVPRLSAYQMFLNDGALQAPEQITSSWNLFSEHEYIHPVHGGTPCSVEGATTLSFDQLCDQLQLNRLDLIKLDVDGFETPVLRGALRTLERFRPTIMLELSDYVHRERGYSFEEFIKVISDAGYKLVNLSRTEELPSDANRLRKIIPVGGGINALAVPRGSVDN